MRRLLLVGAAALTVALATGPALAGPGGSDRPFKGTAAGTTTLVGFTPPSTFSSSSTGTMIATHLGLGTYTISATQTWSGGCAAVAGTFTFVAANGATLTGTLSGTTCEQAPFDDTTYGSALTATITGGTGRLAGATGTLAVTGTSTRPNGLTPVLSDVSTLVGTITY